MNICSHWRSRALAIGLRVSKFCTSWEQYVHAIRCGHSLQKGVFVKYVILMAVIDGSTTVSGHKYLDLKA